MSCVVYASKFKPVEAGMGIGGLRAAPVNQNTLIIPREHRKPRETITNAHDWVWLGKCTVATKWKQPLYLFLLIREGNT